MGAGREFAIKSAPKDAAHPFHGKGHAVGFTIDGIPGGALTVVRGSTYQFNVDTGVQHDFYLTTHESGGGGGTVTQGVFGQFTYRGQVTFTPGPGTPAALWYQCRNHRYMGGLIRVVEPGSTEAVLSTVQPGPAVVTATPEPAAPVLTTPAQQKQVQQKLDFADVLVNQSKVALRLEKSEDPKAKKLHQQAREKITAARETLAKGDNSAAEALADEAVRGMSMAARLLPSSQEELADPKLRYKELLDAVQTFAVSYQQNRQRLQSKKGEQANVLDEKAFNELISEAKADEKAGNLEEANRKLGQAQRLVAKALAQLMASEVVVYDKTFASPKEEYEDELARYRSYEELIPLAIEQKKPTPLIVDQMDEFVKKGDQLHKEAALKAEAKDHKAAIALLQDATAYLQRALLVAGVQ